MKQHTKPSQKGRCASKISYKLGTRGTYSGYEAAIIRQYDGDMYEIRLPSGAACIDIHDFALTETREGYVSQEAAQ